MSFGKNTTCKRIFVIFPSASGHINPICGLVYELCRRPGIECVFYGVQEHRELIEKTGAQFRLYSDRNIADLVHSQIDNKKESLAVVGVNKMMDASFKLLPELIRDAENEFPDLIIYDFCFFPAKYLIELMRRRGKPIKQIEFYPNFVHTKEMLAQSNLFKKDFKLVVWLFLIFLRQMWLSLKFGLGVFNPFGFFLRKGQHPKIVSVVPDLQPDRHQFDETYKFVGPCVSEESRNHEINHDPEMDAILKQFPIKLDNGAPPSNQKLIYMSLGTMFNNNIFIYEKVIEALRKFANGENHFSAIISVGENGLKILNDKLSKGELDLAKNIHLRAKVPQLDVLKRADLFITHCGMNSTSEAIKYGVPIVAIPIDSDQPVNARRVCDQLGFGLRLDPLKLDPEEITVSIGKVLGDDFYRNNINEFSRISAKYVGQVEGTQIVLELLDVKGEDEKKKD